MKKLLILSAVFAAGLLATSCSSSDEVVAPVVDNSKLFNANGEAFLTVSINQPVQTRAFEENSDHLVGTASDADAAVDNAMLVLFAGPNEDDATFVAAYDLGSLKAGAAVANDLQKTYTVTIKNDEKITSNILYAFVAVNYQTVYTIEGTGLKVTTNDGIPTTIAATTKFSEFKTLQINRQISSADSWLNDDDHILMTNAPLSNVYNTKNATAPANINVTTLVPINETNLKPTKEASAAAPVYIYVERVVAKVQVVKGTGTDNTGGLMTETVWGGVKWTADNQEPTYYAVRNVANINEYFALSSSKLLPNYHYRFLGSVVENTTTDATPFYRIYWAEDPHYNYNASSTAETFYQKDAVNTALGTSTSEYVVENTMNEWGLTQDKTTRVLIEIPFKNEAFYTYNGVDETLTETGVEEKVQAYAKGMGTIKSYVTNTLGETYDDTKVTADVSYDTTNKKIVVTIKYNGTEITASNATGVDKLVETLKLKYYPTGKAYYSVRIRHFGDDEAPYSWDDGGTDYTTVYGTSPSPADLLGRYGVVRNNYYYITIDKINHIGHPTIPTPTTTTDDELDQYLSTTIYVTKWAKRTQGAEL